MTTFEAIYRSIGWWVIRIDLVFIILLIIGSLLLFLKKRKWGLPFLWTSCLGFAFFAIVPIGLWMVEALENRFPPLHSIPHDTKGIILLGGSFDSLTTKNREQTAYNLTGGRFIRFVQLIKSHPHLKLFFTGTPFEAETIQKELHALGIDPTRLHLEKTSTNTIDNAFNTAKTLNQEPNEKWLLITSAYHMPRSVGLFRKAGINIIPYPVDYHTPGKYEPFFFIGLMTNLEGWYAASREWLGMTVNYLLNRSDTLYPAPFSLKATERTQT